MADFVPSSQDHREAALEYIANGDAEDLGIATIQLAQVHATLALYEGMFELFEDAITKRQRLRYERERRADS